MVQRWKAIPANAKIYCLKNKLIIHDLVPAQQAEMNRGNVGEFNGNSGRTMRTRALQC